MKKFNIGDIIVYGCKLGFLGFAKSDVGREQIVLDYSDEMYYTEFLDNGRKNAFVNCSPYYDACKVVGTKAVGSGFNYQYDNGVPIIWED